MDPSRCACKSALGMRTRKEWGYTIGGCLSFVAVFADAFGPSLWLVSSLTLLEVEVGAATATLFVKAVGVGVEAISLLQ